MSDFTYASTNRKKGARVNARNSEASFLENNLLKLVIVTGLAYLVWNDKLSINLNFGGEETATAASVDEGKSVKASIFSAETAARKNRKALVSVELPAGSLNNLTLAIDPAYARRNGLSAEEAELRLQRCQDYIKRFAPVAVAEMRQFGIPASVTLAQGLLESNAGDSKLARTTNNHFGIKCFSKKCKKGHCANFSDDTHKDFFVKYQNSWGSYRAHSLFLKNAGRYDALFQLDKTDFRAWAKGLSKAGYATDKRYADKLTAIIANLGLDKYDTFQ